MCEVLLLPSFLVSMASFLFREAARTKNVFPLLRQGNFTVEIKVTEWKHEVENEETKEVQILRSK
jgi:hypothetical protein